MGQSIATDAERTTDLVNQIARQVDWVWAWLRPQFVQLWLALERDGITFRDHRSLAFEIATAATVSVLDRAGRRLRTCYLA
jgi:hypothetical protein